jgi:hypothetical protein
MNRILCGCAFVCLAPWLPLYLPTPPIYCPSAKRMSRLDPTNRPRVTPFKLLE